MKKLIFTILSAILLLPLNAKAWGDDGHRIVAEIAYSMLRPETKTIVKNYLGDISIPQAGTWMDDMKDVSTYSYMSNWHFINLEKNETYKRDNKRNIANEISNAIDALHNRNGLTNKQIKQYILVLFHLIGDIAQPLHVGYAGDRGGNSIELKYLGRPSNLHRVWDSEIIRSKSITRAQVAALYDGISDEKLAVIQVVDPAAWLKHSRNLLTRVYNFQNKTITQSYVDKNTTVVKEQLLFAAIRLAATLESIFGE